MTGRLNRIEAIRERTAQRAEAIRGAFAQLSSNVSSLVQVVEIHQFNDQATQCKFEGIVTKLREIKRQENGE